jgi:ketosteroid isomerase-like protein
MEKPFEDPASQPLAAETEALREAYAALNRNDLPAFVEMLDPQIEWIEPTEFPGGGTYRGLEVVTAHLSQARGSWAEGSCEPERFLVAGDRIILFAFVRVRLKHETEWREGRIADVYTFRDGKAIQKRTFTDIRQALEWAGVKAS